MRQLHLQLLRLLMPAEHSTARHGTAQHSGQYLDEAILSEGNKGNGCCGDEHASYWDEAADEDKQAQQANPWDLQKPHAQRCQGCVSHCNLSLQHNGAAG